jgi:hypothetical protein
MPKALCRLFHAARDARVTGEVERDQRNLRAIFHTRHVARVGFGVVATGPELFIQLSERSAGDHLRTEGLIFCLSTVHPMDYSRLGKGRHLLNPLEEVFIVSQWLRMRSIW